MLVLDLDTAEHAVVPLRDGTVIGAESEIAPLEGPGVSARHACIHVRQQGIVIEDLDSEGGTWVQGVRIRRGLISNGDLVRFGERLTMLVEHDLDAHRGPIVTLGNLVHGPAQRAAWLDPVLDRIAAGVSVAMEGPPGGGKRAIARLASAWREESVTVVEPGDTKLPELSTTCVVVDADDIGRTTLKEFAALAQRRPGTVVIATLSRSLDQAVRDGRIPATFRGLIAGKAFHVPPIDERTEDLPLIVAGAARRHGIDVQRISAAFLERLLLAGWPKGLSPLDELLSTAAQGDGPLRLEATSVLPRRSRRRPLPLAAQDADLRLTRMADALARANGSIALAARALGVSRQCFYRQSRDVGIRLTTRVAEESEAGRGATTSE